MNKNIQRTLTLFASATLFFGLTACAPETPTTDDPAPSDSLTTTEDAHSNEAEESVEEVEEDSAPAQPPVDRSALPWNDEMPAEFPLEDVPLPPNGTFDYAELVEEDVWNVMISDVPKEDHEEWLQTMESQFNRQSGGLSDMTFIGKAASGKSYIIAAMIFDENEDTLIMTYRVS